jgi:hypothetical protein
MVPVPNTRKGETKVTLITPKFLTEALASEAVHVAFNAMFIAGKAIFEPKRTLAHIVIVVPGRQQVYAEVSPRDIMAEFQPVQLYEESFGDPDDFPHPFHEIARSKARELWFGQQDGGSDLLPHLLYAGDTPYWGGVRRGGIAVACSGIEPWKDRAAAGIVADSLIALAYDAWMRSKDKAEGVSFLS